MNLNHFDVGSSVERNKLLEGKMRLAPLFLLQVNVINKPGVGGIIWKESHNLMHTYHYVFPWPSWDKKTDRPRRAGFFLPKRWRVPLLELSPRALASFFPKRTPSSLRIVKIVSSSRIHSRDYLYFIRAPTLSCTFLNEFSPEATPQQVAFHFLSGEAQKKRLWILLFFIPIKSFALINLLR